MASMIPSPTKTLHHEPYPSIDPTRPELNNNGKSIVVTGGGMGIGFSIARAFAASGAANIALLGRTEAVLHASKLLLKKEFPSVQFHALVTDLTTELSIQESLSTFTASISPLKIDILVANAGHMHNPSSLSQIDGDEWWKSFMVNVRGNFNLLRTFQLYAAQDPVVINVSTAGTHLLVPGLSGYTASKLAATQLFDHFKAENTSTRVIQFHPGLIQTEMSQKTAEANPKRQYDNVNLPAHFAVWLSSSEAAFLDGKYVWASWDVNELKDMTAKIEGTSNLTHGLIGWPNI
ncbi:hypothetical protein V8C40DRAFT_268909 [Trichoderma camerunense]